MKNQLKFCFSFLVCFVMLFHLEIQAQSSSISGTLLTENNAPVPYANLALYTAADSIMVKVETTGETGRFKFLQINNGDYFLVSSFIGFEDLRIENITVNDSDLELGELIQKDASVTLETAVVKAKRAMVEVKPDRTVFNVEGTINSVGEDGLNLLRKAPGVLVDNNNNISVLGRSGVNMYVDGKRLPLSGDELVSYLSNLQADQIDRIDIISNPGAKYEAEGNAGIIDIRLKKNKSHGYNGGLSSSFSQGKKLRSNVLFNSNYRNKSQNIFGSIGYNKNNSIQEISFDQQLSLFNNPNNAIRVLEQNEFEQDLRAINYKIGTDFFLSQNHTIGFLINGNSNRGDNRTASESYISRFLTEERTIEPWDIVIPEDQIDSILLASSFGDSKRSNNSFNLNYSFQSGESSLNIDADYGKYRTENELLQPNNYTSSDGQESLTSDTIFQDTPIDIDIYTFKVDFEKPLLGGKMGIGSKYSDVSTDNIFLFFDRENGVNVRNDEKSNEFFYDENVIAAYLTYSRKLSEKWNMSAGVRGEQTKTNGELVAYKEELQTEPVDSSYLSLFPSLGITYQASRRSTLAFNYGRRINRPDYNVLNPFKTQISELGFSIGDPGLQPEIVNNLELGWTFDYRYNFKLAYSKTSNQITRLIGQDADDERASFINYDNLADQTVYSLNISAPFQINDKWSSYWNIGFSNLKNTSDDGMGNVIDLTALSYNLYQQQTITLPYGFIGEISGWFSGPGIWGGVFEYDTSWALNLGLQKKFLADKLNVKLSFSDIFDQAYWSGTSNYDGLSSYGAGNFDNQRVTISLSYNFGNSNVKSRKRQTGIDEESKRVGSE